MRVAVVMFVIVLSGPFALAINTPPNGDDLRLVIVPPWRSAQALIQAAGGTPIGPSTAPFAAFAKPNAPDFDQQVRLGGAWGVLDGVRLARICGVSL